MIRSLSLSPRLIGTILLCGSAVCLAQVEDYERYAPRDIRRNAPTGGELVAAPAEVLVDRLVGLRVVGEPFMLERPGLTGVRGVQIFSPLVLVDEELRDSLSAYVGNPLLGSTLAQITGEIRAFAAARGVDLHVYVPAQDLGGAALQILASRDRLVPPAPRRPTRKPEERLSGYVSFQNNGSERTEDERLSLGIAVPELLLGDVSAGSLDYRLTLSPGTDRFRAHTFNLRKELANRDVVRFFGGVIRTRPTVTAGIADREGRSKRLSLRYERPLDARWRSEGGAIGVFEQTASVGFDYKYNWNEMRFGFGAPNVTRTEINQFVFGYRASVKDRFGGNRVRAQWVVSPGGGSRYNRDRLFANATNIDDAGARYWYLHFSAQRRTPLPGGFRLHSTFESQYSPYTLLGSERMSLGGAETIRGYEESEANGDRGWLLRNEVRTPYFSSLAKWVPVIERDRTQLLTFVDLGRVRRNGQRPRTYRLYSAGCGVRYNVRDRLTVDLDYGWQLRPSRVPGNDRFERRAHLTLVAAF